MAHPPFILIHRYLPTASKGTKLRDEYLDEKTTRISLNLSTLDGWMDGWMDIKINYYLAKEISIQEEGALPLLQLSISFVIGCFEKHDFFLFLTTEL